MPITDPEGELEAKIREAERMVAHGEEAKAAFAAISARAEAMNGAVAVVVDAGGRVTSLHLTEHALRLSPSELASTILTTMHQAQRQSSELLEATTVEFYGDGLAAEAIRKVSPKPYEPAMPDETAERDSGQDDEDEDYHVGRILR